MTTAMFPLGCGGAWACMQLVQAQLVWLSRHANGMTPPAGNQNFVRYHAIAPDWRSR